MTNRYKPTLVNEDIYWEEVDRLINAFNYKGTTERFAVFWDRVVKPGNWTTREWDYVVDYAIMSNDTMPLVSTISSYHLKEAFYHHTWVTLDDETDSVWTEVLHVDSRVVLEEDLEEFKQYGKIECGRW